MQFILNSYLICSAISRNDRHSSPSTQCLHIWPPDQFPPANLTLLPVASTIFIPWVESGNLISSTWKRGSSFTNYSWRINCWFIKIESTVRSGALPIFMIIKYYDIGYYQWLFIKVLINHIAMLLNLLVIFISHFSSGWTKAIFWSKLYVSSLNIV